MRIARTTRQLAMLHCTTHAPAAITSQPVAAAAAATTAVVAVARSAQLMPTTRQSSCGKPAGRRRRRLQRARGVRLGLLLRLRVRLSGLLGLLVRSVEELRCCPGVVDGISSCSTAAARASTRASVAATLGGGHHGGPRGRRTAPAGRDQSSFYAEAIADCLEFIKSRSSYMPAKNAT